MSIKNSHQEYYEIADFWKQDLFDNPDDKERILAILSTVPEHAKTVLEVGCGNGAIVNRLKKLERNITRIVGVDISATALQHVTTEKYQANINELKFDDDSFDCVIASEVIEHLTYNDYSIGIKEIQRVAKKWILISVPNSDDLELDLRMCNYCYCWFNPDYHIISFDKEKLEHLFENFEVVFSNEMGPITNKIKYSNFGKFIFHYNKGRLPKIGICPQCGFDYTNFKNKSGLPDSQELFPTNPLLKKLISLNDMLFRMLFTKTISKKRWLLALYKKREK